MSDMVVGGHWFCPNGDLIIACSRPEAGLILYKRWGFRAGQKVLVDSWCERACPQCGCPRERYHASACPQGKGK